MNYKLVKLKYALLALFLFTLCTKLPEIVRVTGIFLNTPLLSMEAGDEYDLVATISPGTADNKTGHLDNFRFVCRECIRW